MAIDFSRLLKEDDRSVLHPREIFLSLPKSTDFQFLRDIQTEVMNRWFKTRENCDNIIKLHVGSGKTLVGLLLLQSSLNEKYGPALYVAPNKQLAQQVIDEAKALGIATTDEPQDSSYANGEAICVINIYKLFNGRSVFGVDTSAINIGTIVIDDVHACLSTVEEQFCLKVQSCHKAYGEILTVLESDLKDYNEARYLEIQAGDPSVYMEIPFWSWLNHRSKIVQVLIAYRKDDSFRLCYPLLRDILQHCRCTINGQGLEIEPHFPATDIIPSFRRAKRRIYMTATLPDDSSITTHFGAKLNPDQRPITPPSSQAVGERMILIPDELNPDISPDQIRELLVEFARSVNVVVIVPSRMVAARWKDFADEIAQGDQVPNVVERLRNGHVGLTVFVNRYDGIDLPGDACRILVIAGLPEVSSYAKIIDGQVLGNSSINLHSQIARIEQGMGRGVRSIDDFCVVLLLGPKLIRMLRSPEGQQVLTTATRVQLDLSRDIAKNLQNASINDIRQIISQCLGRDSSWVKYSKQCLTNLKSDDQLRLDPYKLALSEAFVLACANRPNDAITAIDRVIDQAADNKQTKAWLLSRKAAFQNVIDPEGAQITLTEAYQEDPSVLRPLHSINYSQIGISTRKQSEALVDNHREKFRNTTEMRLFVNAMCSDLQFSPRTWYEFEKAIDELASFLGLLGQRPEEERNEGPDNLWALPNGKFWIIECKNGVTSKGGISKRDLGQLGQSVEWFKKHYPGNMGIPVMIHPKRSTGPGASAVSKMRVIDVQCLKKLRSNLRRFAEQLASGSVSENSVEVAKRLGQFKLNANDLLSAYSVKVKT